MCERDACDVYCPILCPFSDLSLTPPSLYISLSLSVPQLIAGMKQLIGKLNDLWPEHSVALSIPKEVDRSKEKLEGAWETIGIEHSMIDRSVIDH